MLSVNAEVTEGNLKEGEQELNARAQRRKGATCVFAPLR